MRDPILILRPLLSCRLGVDLNTHPLFQLPPYLDSTFDHLSTIRSSKEVGETFTPQETSLWWRVLNGSFRTVLTLSPLKGVPPRKQESIETPLLQNQIYFLPLNSPVTKDPTYGRFLSVVGQSVLLTDPKVDSTVLMSDYIDPTRHDDTWSDRQSTSISKSKRHCRINGT